MSTASLSRQQQRRLKRLCNKVDRLIETDRRFFKRRPDRAHRVRRAFPAEIDVVATLAAAEDLLPEGQAWFTAVRQFRPGVRLRGFFCAEPDLEPDLFPEIACCRLFEGLVEACALAAALTKEGQP